MLPDKSHFINRLRLRVTLTTAAPSWPVGLVLAGIGIVIGLVAALMSSGLVSILLFGVTPTDPAVFIGVPLLLTVVAGLACHIPARRALRVDPLIALRQE